VAYAPGRPSPPTSFPCHPRLPYTLTNPPELHLDSVPCGDAVVVVRLRPGPPLLPLPSPPSLPSSSSSGTHALTLEGLLDEIHGGSGDDGGGSSEQIAHSVACELCVVM